MTIPRIAAGYLVRSVDPSCKEINNFGLFSSQEIKQVFLAHKYQLVIDSIMPGPPSQKLPAPYRAAIPHEALVMLGNISTDNRDVLPGSPFQPSGFYSVEFMHSFQ